jgi:predicted transcriptional regulator
MVGVRLKTDGRLRWLMFPEHIYKLNDGKTYSRTEVIKMILDCIGSDTKNCKQISEELNASYKSISQILRGLVSTEHLITTKTQRFTYYRKPNFCGLAEMFYDKETILKNFKIKGKITRKAEDTPNISYRSKLNDYSSNASSCHITNMEEG